MSWLSKASGKVSKVFGIDTDNFGKIGNFFQGAWDDFTGKTAIDKQNEYNMQMWHMQNAYNTPAAQVARYREAGLNPNLIYGNGSSSAGNASSAPEMEAHHGSAAKIMDLAQFVLQLKNMKAQNNNLNAQTGNINAQTAQHWADVEYKTALVDFYQKHGYFPGQTNAPTNVIKEVMNSNPVKTAEEGLSRFLGGVHGAITTIGEEKEYPGRAMDKAIKAADRRKLNGYERDKFIKNFVNIYKMYH